MLLSAGRSGRRGRRTSSAPSPRPASRRPERGLGWLPPDRCGADKERTRGLMEGVGASRTVTGRGPLEPERRRHGTCVRQGRSRSAGAHADALERAHKRISGARRDIHDVLRAAGRPLPADEEDEELAFAVARLKRERAADLASLDDADIGARAKPSAPPRELRGGPWLTAHVRGQEAARLRSFWDRPLK